VQTRPAYTSPEMWLRIAPALKRLLEHRTLAASTRSRCDMTEVTLNTLMAALSRPAHFPKASDRVHLIVASTPIPFVPPKFEILGSAADALDAEVIFIEASAAIGKSTIAKFMSAALGASILDLSKVPVATGSFRTLLQELENKDQTDPLAAFHAGESPVIIDAMDEGRLLSGDTGIESFLETTADLLQSNRTTARRPKLIIFGRFESIELARSWFELAAPEVTRASVQVGFFDRDAALAERSNEPDCSAYGTRCRSAYAIGARMRHAVSSWHYANTQSGFHSSAGRPSDALDYTALYYRISEAD
jgi:hypothetical protein